MHKFGTINKIEAPGTLGKKKILVLIFRTNFFYFEGPWGLIFDVINSKFTDCRPYCCLQSVKIEINSLQIVISTNFFISPKCFCILDCLGLYFYAINLKFSHIVDNYMAYYLWKFILIAYKLWSARISLFRENVFAFWIS